MGQILTEIAQELKNANKKVQLIYAFNGVGKTRLSREFKELVDPKAVRVTAESAGQSLPVKFLYYNAFTEDLFYWDNDLNEDTKRKLVIRPNNFTDWVLRVQGKENSVAANFQYYTNDKLTPSFNQEYSTKDKDGKDITIPAYSEIKFSIDGGNEGNIDNIKISKGEESSLIWSVFYSLFEQVVDVLNEPELDNRETDRFNDLQYVFIDDPVSSLDDNHLIEIAVNIAELIKSSKSDLRFIITTHNPLFYNVLYNEFNNTDSRYGFKVKHSAKKRLEKLDDGSFLLQESKDSPFSYHLSLLSELEKVVESGEIKKYHFNLLRNIFEKTSTFLGYNRWKDLLPQDSRSAYYNRIIEFSNHSKHHGEEASIVEENDKRVLGFLLEELKKGYSFKEYSSNNTQENNATI